MAYQAHRNNSNEAKDQEQINAENNANTIRNAAKVAEHAGGWAAAAGKAVDIADKVTGGKSTEALGKAMGDATKRMPNGQQLQKASNMLAESGMGDKIGQAADAAKGAEGGLSNKEDGLNSPENKNEIPNKGFGNSFGLDKKNGSGLSEPNEEEDDSLESDNDIQLPKMPNKIKLTLFASVGGFMMFLIIIVAIVGIMFSAGDAVKEFLNDIGNSFVGFFTGENKITEEEFYDTLDKVRNKVQKEDGVCVDINMIIAALTVNKDFDQTLEEGKEELEVSDGGYTKRMQKNIALLAAMQIRHKHYSLDKNATISCKTSEEKVPVTNDNKDSFQLDWVNWWTTDDANYLVKDVALDSPRAVARNDKELNVNFFDKKVSEEKNYAYYIYYPPYDSTDNTCTDTYAKAKLNAINQDEKAELDIGSLKNMKETVFYWNLVDQFIPYYYKDYLPKEEGAERQAAIEKIADDIYALYESMGPNQTCGMTCSSINVGTSGLCPNGIEVNGELIDLETYVAGVVAAENSWRQGDNIENMKAQAIAARTYAINKTNYCQTPIANNSTAQNYIATVNQYAIRAAEETAGIIITKDNLLISTEYDASAVKEVTAEGYILNQRDQLIPKDAADTIGMVDRHKCVCSKYNNGTSDCGNSCHGRGMSQIGARYLQTQGYTFDQILKYYYGDDITIVATSSDNEETADSYRSVIMKCSNRAGFSPEGNFASGMCITKNTSDFKNPSLNPYYEYWTTYNSSYPTYEGECTWYALGRGALALVEGAGMDPAAAQAELSKFRLGNGGDWYKNAKAYIDAGNQWFEISDDIRDVRPGSFVSIQGTWPWNHVIFVETVEYDEEGKAISFTTTERNGTICADNTYKVLGKNSVYIWGGSKQVYGVIFLFGE